MNTITTLSTLSNDVKTVVAAGGTTTKEYDRLIRRWDDFTELGKPATKALTAAILGDTPMERVGELQALALAEQATPIAAADIRIIAAESIYPAVRAEITKAAQSNYETIAKKFTATGKALSRAASVIDPESDPAGLISADDATRKAWTDSGILAHQLNSQLRTLATAARLAGAQVSSDTGLLALTIAPETSHRRRVWEAWQTHGRTGRWAAIHALGLSIEACCLEDHTPYREPAPLETRYERTRFGQQAYSFDPEDQTPDPAES